jgi:SAM-dependent methyltransferase
VPVNSCLSLQTREEADESLLEYSERYDPTQAFSQTFNRWHRQLAESLVERYELRGKRIIEIGCGKGEFLTMLCELGANSGVGFDPAVDSARTRAPEAGEVEFIQDFYSRRGRGPRRPGRSSSFKISTRSNMQTTKATSCAAR